MAPNNKDIPFTEENMDETLDAMPTLVQKKSPPMEIVWRNVLVLAYLHVGALYGVYLSCTQTMLYTGIFGLVYAYMSGLGLTAGAHRLWAHKTYKAKLPLRILLMFFNAMAFENDIYEWSRDHRAHHKFSETDADPHNAKRGFFFAHMGWLMVRKHPEVRDKGGKIDMSDLAADPVVMFQRKYYIPIVFTMCFLLPAIIPHYFWNEDLYIAFYTSGIMRYTMTLHATWAVNSVAHLWGNKPYNKFINPVQNTWVSFFGMGEGWHNYHHSFPYDYKASEIGWAPNETTKFINLMHRLGLAYDLRTVPDDLIKRKIQKSGDGTHKDHQLHAKENMDMIQVPQHEYEY